MVMVAVTVAVAVIILAVIFSIIIYKVRDRSRWKHFVNAHIDYDDEDGIVETPPSYPITHKYYKGARGHPSLYTAPGHDFKISSNTSSPIGGSSTQMQMTYKSVEVV